MKSRAIFILSTFIILLGINKFSLHRDLKKQTEDISTINTSGKQRMYSQKITKLIFYNGKYKNSLANGINSSELKNTVNQFKTAHDNLKTNHLKKYDDNYLKELFNSLENNYSNIVDNVNFLMIKEHDQEAYDDYLKSIKQASDGFLPIMDDIVNHYELIAKQRGERIISREFTFNIILVALSIYGVFFLIIPLANSKKETLT